MTLAQTTRPHDARQPPIPHRKAPANPMSNYRRNRVPGATYFFTVNLQDRLSNLLITEIETLRTAIRSTRTRHPFHIDAWVVLPDHMHCLWTLPPNDFDFPIRWQMIKTTFSRSTPRPKTQRPSAQLKRETNIWQRRYWEHTLRDDQDYAAHIDYIHFNPVKHGLAAHPADWPYSTFAKCVALGIYPPDWATAHPAPPETGERHPPGPEFQSPP